jgi:NAD(P) transhydrogenase subunit alpha
VLLAANSYGRIFPQMMTPAGTPGAVAPIMGVGVAGLRAIAGAGWAQSCDRCGPRPGQVQSLGGKFIAVEDGFKAAETSAGYAKR